MQPADDLPAVSPTNGPPPVACPASSAGTPVCRGGSEGNQTPRVVAASLDFPRPAWFVVLAVAGTLLAGLYPAGGPVQTVGRALSVLLAALLWFTTGYWWARRRWLQQRLSAHGTDPARPEPSPPSLPAISEATDPRVAATLPCPPSSTDERVAGVLGDPAFVGAVVSGVLEKMCNEVPGTVADRLAREVMDSAGDRLADAVADRIADAWQRAARTSNAAAGNGWTLRPRQRGSSASRGRNPKA